MRVANKAIYEGLKEELKLLKGETTAAESIENFNEIGWDITLKELEKLVKVVKELNKIKGERKTPQFYKPIFNRAVIAQEECQKVTDSINKVTVDYAKECQAMRDEIAAIYAAKAMEEDAPQNTEDE